jgi:hypothetical protein
MQEIDSLNIEHRANCDAVKMKALSFLSEAELTFLFSRL